MFQTPNLGFESAKIILSKVQNVFLKVKNKNKNVQNPVQKVPILGYKRMTLYGHFWHFRKLDFSL